MPYARTRKRTPVTAAHGPIAVKPQLTGRLRRAHPA